MLPPIIAKHPYYSDDFFVSSDIMNFDYYEVKNFLHGGQSSYFSRRDEEMEFLDRITALVILKCFELDKTISSNNKKRTITWSKYVDRIFKDLIFGIQRQVPNK